MLAENQYSEEDASKEESEKDNAVETETAEEVDVEELARNRMIDEILVYTVKGGVPKPPAIKEETEQEIKERLSTIGVNIRSMKTISDKWGSFAPKKTYFGSILFYDLSSFHNFLIVLDKTYRRNCTTMSVNISG